jgi:putative thioredoxin
MHLDTHDHHELIFNADEHDFQAKVVAASTGKLILADFWADWCGPCHALTPVLLRVIPEYAGRVLLAKVEADENMKLAGHYKMRGFPTVLLFSGGELKDHFTGAKPAQFVREFIDKHLPPSL